MSVFRRKVAAREPLNAVVITVTCPSCGREHDADISGASKEVASFAHWWKRYHHWEKSHGILTDRVLTLEREAAQREIALHSEREKTRDAKREVGRLKKRIGAT
jgi:transcription elongation factor Elf1